MPIYVDLFTINHCYRQNLFTQFTKRANFVAESVPNKPIYFKMAFLSIPSKEFNEIIYRRKLVTIESIGW